ncbi:hypothetical protein [Opitutus terrae]|uniref:Lipoprotein n=1 Tax=Opitutus terrae (strain DSM 11246 / JCM 15787 / PB90-1) TaxID=452637 RepID=B1ZQT4_OPITP|nr:hypothetical protein [Opitutus terrae]ACB77832.1 hypothetical protein Oter_4561 [Opitutus terrae PB90-1]
MKPILALVLLSALLVSCSSVETRRSPGADLSRYQRFYVVHRLNDDRHIDELIVRRLRELGREASAGHLTMMPENTEAIVTYDDVWAWDFKSYLIQLTVYISDARRERPLGHGSYRQPSPVTKPPQELIRAILDPLLQPRPAKRPPP